MKLIHIHGVWPLYTNTFFADHRRRVMPLWWTPLPRPKPIWLS